MIPKGFISLGVKNSWLNVDQIADVAYDGDKALIICKHGEKYTTLKKLVNRKERSEL